MASVASVVGAALVGRVLHSNKQRLVGIVHWAPRVSTCQDARSSTTNCKGQFSVPAMLHRARCTLTASTPLPPTVHNTCTVLSVLTRVETNDMIQACWALCIIVAIVAGRGTEISATASIPSQCEVEDGNVVTCRASDTHELVLDIDGFQLSPTAFAASPNLASLYVCLVGTLWCVVHVNKHGLPQVHHWRHHGLSARTVQYSGRRGPVNPGGAVRCGAADRTVARAR